MKRTGLVLVLVMESIDKHAKRHDRTAVPLDMSIVYENAGTHNRCN